MADQAFVRLADDNAGIAPGVALQEIGLDLGINLDGDIVGCIGMDKANIASSIDAGPGHYIKSLALGVADEDATQIGVMGTGKQAAMGPGVGDVNI